MINSNNKIGSSESENEIIIALWGEQRRKEGNKKKGQINSLYYNIIINWNTKRKGNRKII